jgi:putative glutamine amidotransferase
MPAIIGLAANADISPTDQPITSVPFAYSNSVEAAGGVPLILPLTTDASALACMLECVDGLIIPGGIDVAPALFGQEPHPNLGKVNPDLDTFHLALTRLAVAAKKPLLGICRGAQVINVALGGTLYQDIPALFPDSTLCHMQKTLSYDTDHEVSITPGSRLYDIFGPGIAINSRHHQSIMDPGKGIVITGRAPDGVVEAAEHTSLPIDLIQWHPELLMQKNHDMLPLFTYFVQRCCQPS